MPVDWDYLFEKLGQKVADDFADTIEHASQEVRGLLDEADHFAGILRDIGPFVRPLKCAHCGVPVRPNDNHDCPEGREAEPHEDDDVKERETVKGPTIDV